jgi:hypothetical protein
MEIIALALLIFCGVLAIGGGIVMLIGLLPLSLLERAQEHGRFAGLGSPESVVRPGKLSLDRSIAGHHRGLHAA